MKKIADTFKERDNNLVFIFFLELDFESCLKSCFINIIITAITIKMITMI